MDMQGNMSPQQSHQVRDQQSPREAGGQQPVHSNGHPGGTQWFQPTIQSKIAVVLVTVAAILVIGAFLAGLLVEDNSASSMVKTNQRQAVFLSNDQVYFGDITKINDDLLVLENVYYLQVNQQIQPDQENAQGARQQQQPQVSLTQLGNELHGPEDKMFITPDKVVFWENLKPDGQVSQAIKQNEQNQQNQQSNGGTNSTQQPRPNGTSRGDGVNGQSNGQQTESEDTTLPEE